MFKRIFACLWHRISFQRLPRAAPVIWVRTDFGAGTLLVQTGRRSWAQLNLDDDAVLDIAARLRRSPGLGAVDIEVLHPMFRQAVHVGPRVMPWLRCLFNVLAQEIEQKRRGCECAASALRRPVGVD